MIRKTIAMGAAVCTLSACATYYPLPIQEPPAKDSNDIRTKPDYQRGGLLPAEKYEEAVENLKIYADSYQDTSDSLRRKIYISGDVGLGGGILGVAGGLTKSVETAIAGAVLASGSSLYTQHYQILVQATNYEKASDAMYCMYSTLYASGNESLGHKFINEKIDQVRRKLRKVQASIQLATPDLSQLEKTVQTAMETKGKKGAANANYSKIKVLGKNIDSAKKDSDDADIAYLKAELEKCVATF